MLLVISLALLNGILIGVSRATNGYLGRKIGAIRTAFWVHLIGFLFLTIMGVALYRGEMRLEPGVPLSAWFGGALGVLFVAFNSHVVSKLGASQTTSFVVAAQMITSVVVDSIGLPISAATAVAAAGAVLIIAGVWMSVSARRSGAT
jgi:transporter family-2 protein